MPGVTTVDDGGMFGGDVLSHYSMFTPVLEDGTMDVDVGQGGIVEVAIIHLPRELHRQLKLLLVLYNKVCHLLLIPVLQHLLLHPLLYLLI